MDREDVENMTGHMVGRHLMAAGRASQRGQTYDFPGGVLFPLHRFEY